MFSSVLIAAAVGVLTIGVHGSPFVAVPSPDGSALFVSVHGQRSARNEIEVFRRDGNSYTMVRSIPVDGLPSGMAVTPDGKTLLVADGRSYAAISTASALSDGPHPFASIVPGAEAGAIEVAVSPDGRYAFFTNEEASSVGVVSVEPATSSTGSPKLNAIGTIPVDHYPVGLAFAPDGRTLYVTSETSSGRPVTCGDHPVGTLSVVDVAKAESNPNSAVITSVAAGCEPVRVAVSPDGATVWVSVRGDDRLDAFDAVALLKDPAHALVAQTSVGSAPVGLLATSDGKYVLIANSDRFNRSSTGSTVEILDARDARAGSSALVRTIPSGSFPRELRESPQKDAIYLTNYSGGTVEVMPEPLVSL